MAESSRVAQLLREVREQRGESLRSAARSIEVTPSYLSRVETGDRSPSQSVQERASSHYGIDPDLVRLAAGEVPEDILSILQKHPEILGRLRSDYA